MPRVGAYPGGRNLALGEIYTNTFNQMFALGRISAAGIVPLYDSYLADTEDKLTLKNL